jgi:predicted flavoprotein YhiN
MGATAFGYDLARQFGLNVIATKPGLVPFLLGGKDYKLYSDLAGVSAEVIASANHHAFREKMLITHRGLSGPAILQISSYWDKGQSVQIDLAPDRESRSDSRSKGANSTCPSRLPGNPAKTLRRTLAN